MSNSIVVAKSMCVTPIYDINLSNIFVGSHSVLIHYMERNNKESLIDLRSPLFKSYSRDEALEFLYDLLMKNELNNYYTYIPPEILRNEDAARLKTTSKSRRLSYGKRFEKIIPYFKDLFRLNREHKRILSSHVLPKVFCLLAKGRLRMLKPENAVHMIKKNTQWGLPYLTKGEISWRDHLKIVTDCIATQDSSYIMQLPCILGWRGQPGKNETAQRVVWMYPHSASIMDAMIMKPLMRALENKREFIMLKGEFKCSSYITGVLRLSNESGFPCLGFDASAFDSSIIREVIQLSFEAIRYWFQASAVYVISVCEQFLMESNLIGLDLISGRTSSMPSGSGFTNILDTIIQYMYFLFVAYFLKGDESFDVFLLKCHFTGMGDDGVWLIPGLSIKALTKILSYLNVTCEPTKQSFSTDYVSFCQNIYSINYCDDFGRCRGVRSVIRTFNSMISMERFRKGFTASFHSVRWLVQLEDVIESPFFPELFTLVINNDRFKLGLSLPNRLKSLFKEVGNLSNYFKILGDNFRLNKTVREDSSINSLRIFRIINSLDYQDYYSTDYIRNFISANKHLTIRDDYAVIRIANNADYSEYISTFFTLDRGIKHH